MREDQHVLCIVNACNRKARSTTGSVKTDIRFPARSEGSRSCPQGGYVATKKPDKFIKDWIVIVQEQKEELANPRLRAAVEISGCLNSEPAEWTLISTAQFVDLPTSFANS